MRPMHWPDGVLPMPHGEACADKDRGHELGHRALCLVRKMRKTVRPSMHESLMATEMGGEALRTLFQTRS